VKAEAKERLRLRLRLRKSSPQGAVFSPESSSLSSEIHIPKSEIE
jgi:hypothetical protein